LEILRGFSHSGACNAEVGNKTTGKFLTAFSHMEQYIYNPYVPNLSANQGSLHEKVHLKLSRTQNPSQPELFPVNFIGLLKSWLSQSFLSSTNCNPDSCCRLHFKRLKKISKTTFRKAPSKSL
jgi:hypothetical protein